MRLGSSDCVDKTRTACDRKHPPFPTCGSRGLCPHRQSVTRCPDSCICRPLCRPDRPPPCAAFDCRLILGYQFLFLCAAGAADGLRSAAVDQRKGVLFCFGRRFAESPQTELFRCAIQVEPWCTGERAAGSGSRIPKCGCPVTHHVPTTASSTTTSPAAASGAGTNGNLWTTGHQQGNKHCH